MQEASAEESKNNSAPPKESENEQMKSVEEEWRQLKIQNHVLNTENRSINVDATLKFQDMPLSFEGDGTLQFFWTDAHEEQNGAEIFLFGKIW